MWFLVLIFCVFQVNSQAWNPWKVMYQRNKTAIPNQADRFAFYANTELKGNLIDPSLEIYFQGYYPYNSYMSISTYDDANGLLFSQLTGVELTPDSGNLNPYQAGNNVTSLLETRSFQFVVVHSGNNHTFWPNVTNRLYWSVSPQTGRIRTTSITYRAYNAFQFFPPGLDTPIPLPIVTQIVVKGQVVPHPEEYFNSLVTQIFNTFFEPAVWLSVFYYGILPNPIRESNAYANPWESPDALMYPPILVLPSQVLWYRWPSRSIPFSDQTIGSTCANYLIGTVPRTATYRESAAIIRIKLPTTFNAATDATFPANLDAAYFSISSYSYELIADYTVNGNELEAWKDSQGFVTIFVLPPRFRDALPNYVVNGGAPSYQWGVYQGLVLPYPRYSPQLLLSNPNFPDYVPMPFLVLREKQQQEPFRSNGGVDGSLGCATNLTLAQITGPLYYDNWQASGSKSNMGPYAPVTFSDSFQNFIQYGRIGPIEATQPWPELAT